MRKNRYVFPSVLGGVQLINPGGGEMLLADDQIPDLIAELQNYMSRKANEIAKAARQ